MPHLVERAEIFRQNWGDDYVSLDLREVIQDAQGVLLLPVTDYNL